jgi:hypothetical protein
LPCCWSICSRACSVLGNIAGIEPIIFKKLNVNPCARDRLSAIESDLAPTVGAAPAEPAAATLGRLRGKTHAQVSALEEELIDIEVQNRFAEEAARGEQALTLASQVGLLIVVLVEVIVVVWASHASVTEKIVFSAGILVTTAGYVALGEATEAGKVDRNTLVVRRQDSTKVVVLQAILVVLSQAEFDGGSVPRVRPRGKRAFGDGKSEEVSRGVAGACDAAGVRVWPADRACRA